MKANKKGNEVHRSAVSSVIGVVLMVAITAAIAAAVYFYVIGMFGSGEVKTPSITFLADNSGNLVSVIKADPDIAWSDIVITGVSGGGYTLLLNTDFVISHNSMYVTAGDTISANTYLSQHAGDSIVLMFRYEPTNILIASVTVS